MLFTFGFAGAALLILPAAPALQDDLNSNDMGTMSRLWLAEAQTRSTRDSNGWSPGYQTASRTYVRDRGGRISRYG